MTEEVEALVASRSRRPGSRPGEGSDPGNPARRLPAGGRRRLVPVTRTRSRSRPHNGRLLRCRTQPRPSRTDASRCWRAAGADPPWGVPEAGSPPLTKLQDSCLVAPRPARLLSPKRLLTPRIASQISPTDPGLLLDFPAMIQSGLAPAGLVQLPGRNTGRGYRAGTDRRPDRSKCSIQPSSSTRMSSSTYLSSLTLRRGLRANHHMLTIVATTPSAAAGFAILWERSDMRMTIPGSALGPQIPVGGQPRHVPPHGRT